MTCIRIWNKFIYGNICTLIPCTTGYRYEQGVSRVKWEKLRFNPAIGDRTIAVNWCTSQSFKFFFGIKLKISVTDGPNWFYFSQRLYNDFRLFSLPPSSLLKGMGVLALLYKVARSWKMLVRILCVLCFQGNFKYLLVVSGYFITYPALLKSKVVFFKL